jgi:hypothetical protein
MEGSLSDAQHVTVCLIAESERFWNIQSATCRDTFVIHWNDCQRVVPYPRVLYIDMCDLSVRRIIIITSIRYKYAPQQCENALRVLPDSLEYLKIENYETYIFDFLNLLLLQHEASPIPNLKTIIGDSAARGNAEQG